MSATPWRHARAAAAKDAESGAVKGREGSGRTERVRALWEMNARAAAAPGEAFDHGLFELIEEPWPAEEHRPRAAPRRHG